MARAAFDKQFNCLLLLIYHDYLAFTVTNSPTILSQFRKNDDIFVDNMARQTSALLTRGRLAGKPKISGRQGNPDPFKAERRYGPADQEIISLGRWSCYEENGGYAHLSAGTATMEERTRLR
jgi:hypothetical protein